MKIDNTNFIEKELDGEKSLTWNQLLNILQKYFKDYKRDENNNEKIELNDAIFFYLKSIGTSLPVIMGYSPGDPYWFSPAYIIKSFRTGRTVFSVSSRDFSVYNDDEYKILNDYYSEKCKDKKHIFGISEIFPNNYEYLSKKEIFEISNTISNIMKYLNEKKMMIGKTEFKGNSRFI